MKPVITNPNEIKKPEIPNDFFKKSSWVFSFEYFRQTELFGLGEANTNWFISLLEILKDLSKIKIEDFEKDRKLKAGYRYHEIDWSAHKIPIERKDIDWVKKEVIENEEDFPFYQFHVSKALGRVVGFWDIEELNKFQIVLLDYHHNLQPSKYSDYKIDDTTELKCEYKSLLADIDNIKKTKCDSESCSILKEINKIPTKLNRGNFVYFLIEDEYYEEFKEKTKDKSLKELVELGLLAE